jgi:hypothetical protein
MSGVTPEKRPAICRFRCWWPAPENEFTPYVTPIGAIWCDRAMLPAHGSTVSGAGGRYPRSHRIVVPPPALEKHLRLKKRFFPELAVDCGTRFESAAMGQLVSAEHFAWSYKWQLLGVPHHSFYDFF